MTMEGDSIWGSKDYQVPQYFNFADVIDDWAGKEKRGEKTYYNPALWWIDGEGQEVKWSFQDLASNSKRAANVLCTVADITPGDRVMVLVRRIPEYWLIQVACLRTGAILVPAPTNIGSTELQRRISLSKPSCFVSSGVIENDLLYVIDQFSSSSSAVKFRLMFNRMKKSNRDNWLSFDKLLQQASGEYQSVKSLSSAPITIVFTSGTTGNAKMVEHSQGSWGLQNRTGMERRGMGIVESDLVWSQSATGWVILLCMAMSSWSVGAGVFAHYKDVNAREALETLRKFPVTFSFLLPSIYINAVKEDLKDIQFSKLSSCMATGEPMNKDVMLKWKEATGIDIRNIYGQTEAGRSRCSHRGALCCTPRCGEVRLGSVGPAFPSVDLVITGDNNQEMSPGQTGRVMVRVKPYRPVPFFTRYVEDPQRTAACFSGDFYITGDVGFKDKDGYFWILGRTDDIILVNGVNINPYDVEHCLAGHPAVSKCAVVSSPNPTGQECAKAFVVLTNEFKNKEQDEMIKELQDHVIKNTGAWMKPAKIEFVDTLPHTLTGKIKRKELKEKEWKSFKEIR